MILLGKQLFEFYEIKNMNSDKNVMLLNDHDFKKFINLNFDHIKYIRDTTSDTRFEINIYEYDFHLNNIDKSSIKIYQLNINNENFVIVRLIDSKYLSFLESYSHINKNVIGFGECFVPPIEYILSQLMCKFISNKYHYLGYGQKIGFQFGFQY